MKEYLNMANYFHGQVSIDASGFISDDKYSRGSTDIAEDYYEPICHAINSHDELVEMNKELLAALEGLVSITCDSRGVVGYHLNGDIAEWGEFEEVAVAHDTIVKAKGGAA